MISGKKEIFKLITIYGNVITIEVDESNSDGVLEEITDSLENDSLYYIGNYQERVIFKGHELIVIDFKKIIGRY